MRLFNVASQHWKEEWSKAIPQPDNALQKTLEFCCWRRFYKRQNTMWTRLSKLLLNLNPVLFSSSQTAIRHVSLMSLGLMEEHKTHKTLKHQDCSIWTRLIPVNIWRQRNILWMSYLSDRLSLIHHHGLGALIRQMDPNHQLRTTAREEKISMNNLLHPIWRCRNSTVTMLCWKGPALCVNMTDVKVGGRPEPWT